MVYLENLQQLKKWVGFVGTVTLIMGIIFAILGLMALVVGAIPGIISIIMATRLLDAKKSMMQILEDNPEDQSGQLNMIVIKLTSYFMIQGVLIIIGLILAILSLMSVGILPFLIH